MSWKIYHNSKCSKSRQTLGLLQENGIEPEVIEYLKNPPTREEIQGLISTLGSSEILVRTKEEEFKSKPFDITDSELVAKKLVEMPRLMERPVVIHCQLAVIGRPPENVLKMVEKIGQ